MSRRSRANGKQVAQDAAKLANDLAAPTSTTGRTTRRRRRRTRRSADVVFVPGPNHSETSMRVPRNAKRISAGASGWLRTYLNPCGEMEPDMNGVPDGASTESAVVNVRGQYAIAPPEAFTDGTDQTKDTWCLMMVVPPVYEDCMWLFASRLEFDVDNLWSHNGSGVAMSNVYPSWTAVTGTTTTVYACCIQNAQMVDAIGSSPAPASTLRTIAKGVTTELIASELIDMGYVTAAQWKIEASPITAITSATGFVSSTSGGSPTVSATYLTGAYQAKGLLIGNCNPVNLAAANTKCLQGQAKDGCYMPLYKSNDTYDYHAFENFPTYARYTGSTVAETYNSDYNRVQDYGINTGVIWYSEISVGASVRVKSRHFIQAVAEPGGAWQSFVRVTADENAEALRVANEIRNKLAHAYPAAYNDWGFLGNLVKGLSLIHI